jgi:hypothetical protein
LSGNTSQPRLDFAEGRQRACCSGLRLELEPAVARMQRSEDVRVAGSADRETILSARSLFDGGRSLIRRPDPDLKLGRRGDVRRRRFALVFGAAFPRVSTLEVAMTRMLGRTTSISHVEATRDHMSARTVFDGLWIDP